MSALAILRRHARLVSAIVLIELALGWLFAHVLVRAAHNLLVAHPDGVRALFTHGARGVFDLANRPGISSALRGPTVALAIGLLLYALVGIAIDTLAASAFTRERTSLRALGTVIIIDLAAVLAYAVCAFLGSLTAGGAHLATHTWANAIIADVVVLAALAPTLVVALLVHVVRDLSLVRATTPSDVLSSVGDAVSQLARHPRETLGVRVVILIASLLLLAFGSLASWNIDGAPVFVVIACVAVQQIAAASRTLLRMQWLAHAAARWQPKTLQTPNT